MVHPSVRDNLHCSDRASTKERHSMQSPHPIALLRNIGNARSRGLKLKIVGAHRPG